MKPRIVPDADRGGFLVIHQGATYWAKNRQLAQAIADVVSVGGA